MAMTQANAAAGEVRPIDRIVVPVAGTDREYLVQEHAVQVAAALEAPLLAVHVVTPTEPANPQLFHWIDKIAASWNVSIDHHTIDGSDPATVLVEELEPRDLCIIGSERMGERFHFDSVAESLIAHAPCPVQVVRLSD